MNQQESNQRLFDEALQQIRKQGGPSIDSMGDCVYCDEDGKRCAFGPAIKDYSPDMEGNNAESFYPNNEIDKTTVMGRDVIKNREMFHDTLHDWAKNADWVVATKIQFAHDTAAEKSLNGRWINEDAIVDNDSFYERFESAMQKVANEHNLDYQKPTEVTNG